MQRRSQGRGFGYPQAEYDDSHSKYIDYCAVQLARFLVDYRRIAVNRVNRPLKGGLQESLRSSLPCLLEIVEVRDVDVFISPKGDKELPKRYEI